MIRQTTFIVLALARRRPGESPRGLARDRVREEVRVVASATTTGDASDLPVTASS